MSSFKILDGHYQKYAITVSNCNRVNTESMFFMCTCVPVLLLVFLRAVVILFFRVQAAPSKCATFRMP